MGLERATRTRRQMFLIKKGRKSKTTKTVEVKRRREEGDEWPKLEVESI